MKNKIMILVLVLILTMSTVVFAKVITPEVISFSDVPLTHWAVEHIYEAQSKGIVNGYPDGTFAPEANVAVGEFIKMTNLLMVNVILQKKLQLVQEDVTVKKRAMNYAFIIKQAN